MAEVRQVVMDKPEPSKEIQEILHERCNLQREKYGPNWKRILAKEMAEKQRSVLENIARLGRGHG
jgi:hypothetical protein